MKRLCDIQSARIMVSGGGTGGHIMPALALCEAILARDTNAVLWYIGRGRSMEERLAGSLGLPFKRLHASPLRRGLVPKMLATATMALGIIEAIVFILRFRPHAIVGFGGYASFPLLLAGLVLRRTVIVHEANALPGKAVALLARFGAQLAYGLVPDDPDSALARMVARLGPRAHSTGNPIRRSFFDTSAAKTETLTGFSGSAPTLMILGGSQGSRTLNAVAPQTVARLRSTVAGLRVIHLAGSTEELRVRAAYTDLGVPCFVSAFSDEIGGLYRMASAVVARAGALTVSEICAAGVPAVLVPYPFAAEDHQTSNARVLEQAGGAVLIQEADLDADRLAGVLENILTSGRADAMRRANRALARPDAADRLIDVIEQCLND